MQKGKNYRNIVIITLLFAMGCAQPVKMYSGDEKTPAELAVVYRVPTSLVDIRYLNDKHVGSGVWWAPINFPPGNNKFTFVHFDTTYARRTLRTIWTMYSVSANLRAGYTYISWSVDGSATIPPDAVCLLEYSHEDFKRLYGNDPRKFPVILDPGKALIGCGGKINAPEYVNANGKP